MNVTESLKRASLNLAALHRLTGLSRDLLKSLSSGRREATPAARARLAHAYRTHAGVLLTEADTLDPQPANPDANPITEP